MSKSCFQHPKADPIPDREKEGKQSGKADMEHSARRPHVLMIGPGAKVRGGITSVIAAYRGSRMWGNYSCEWLSTYDDRGPLWKIVAALRAYVIAPALIYRADIVHVHGEFRKSFLRKLPLILLARAMRKSVIYHVHAFTMAGVSTGPLAPIIRWTLTSVNKVIALSPIWAAEIQKCCPTANVIVLPNPVIMPTRQISQHSEAPGQRILFLGKLERRKGFRDLLMAMPAVLAAAPEADLVFAGNGDLEGARLLASELGIRPSVSLLGFIRGERKRIELQRASVIALPSYEEGVPITLLEGMSYGIPVVTTPVGGIPDLICSGENGLLVPPGDIPELACAIVKLLTNPRLSTSIGNAGFLHVERSHSIDHVCDLLDGIYASLNKQTKAPLEGSHAVDNARQQPNANAPEALRVR